MERSVDRDFYGPKIYFGRYCLYIVFVFSLSPIIGKIKRLELTDVQLLQLENGLRHGSSYCFRMRYCAVLLKAEGLCSAKAGEQTDMSLVSVDA